MQYFILITLYKNHRCNTVTFPNSKIIVTHYPLGLPTTGALACIGKSIFSLFSPPSPFIFIYFILCNRQAVHYCSYSQFYRGRVGMFEFCLFFIVSWLPLLGRYPIQRWQGGWKITKWSYFNQKITLIWF